MPAYAIGRLDIHDPDACRACLDGFTPSFERHAGELPTTWRAETEAPEGVWALPRTVVMRFPLVAAAKAWRSDPDDVARAEIRHRTARIDPVVIDGIV
ncbi:MAG TPA: DUF1330 domain-containing protein [Paracoccaceae bacterium]|nr:DUF1330 domain-containing protein [Paracoccaceae bacterium]